MSASQQIRTAATAYRAVRKACRTLFAGDAAGLEKALAETRFRFYENAAVSADKVPGLVDDAHETAFFLLENVAQTQMNERGNYGACIPL